jgi:hypothetical protein
MAEDEKRERALGLSPAQVVGSALAATSAALIASTTGTAGTIIGAGVGSIVATVGSAIYTWWLRRTSEIARRTAAQMRLAALATQPLPRTVAQGPMRFRRDRGSATDQAAGRPEEESATVADTDAGPRSVPQNGEESGEESGDEPGFRLPWGKVLVATAVVAAITLGTITLIEGIAGRPVSSLTGGSDSTGTSVGHVVGSDDDEKAPAEDEQPTPAPSEEPAPTEEPGSTEVPEPTPTSTPEEPEPSVTPTDEPSPTESVEPEGAPAP